MPQNLYRYAALTLAGLLFAASAAAAPFAAPQFEPRAAPAPRLSDPRAEVRQLRTEILLTRAEVEARRRYLRGFEPFTRFAPEDGAPFTLSVEQAKLDLLDSELRLNELSVQLFESTRYDAVPRGVAPAGTRSYRGRSLDLQRISEVARPVGGQLNR